MPACHRCPCSFPPDLSITCRNSTSPHSLSCPSLSLILRAFAHAAPSPPPPTPGFLLSSSLGKVALQSLTELPASPMTHGCPKGRAAVMLSHVPWAGQAQYMEVLSQCQMSCSQAGQGNGIFPYPCSGCVVISCWSSTRCVPHSRGPGAWASTCKHRPCTQISFPGSWGEQGSLPVADSAQRSLFSCSLPCSVDSALTEEAWTPPASSPRETSSPHRPPG